MAVRRTQVARRGHVAEFGGRQTFLHAPATTFATPFAPIIFKRGLERVAMAATRGARRHDVRERFVATMTRAIVATCHAIPAGLAYHRVALVDVTTMALAPVQVNRRAALRTPLALIVKTTHVVDATHTVPVSTHVELIADRHASRGAVGPLVAIRLEKALPSRSIQSAYGSPPMIAIRSAIVTALPNGMADIFSCPCGTRTRMCAARAG